MKKYIICLIVGLISFTASAQSIQWYSASSYAYRYINNGYWTNWSQWESCSVNIKFDLNSDIISIYSNQPQYYKVLYQEESPYDSSGQQLKFRIIDQDGDYGHIRLRVENNGNSQIYVDFGNCGWVYNVRRTQ